MANSIYSEYLFFKKECIEPESLAKTLVGYDRFVSAFNFSDRVCKVFEKIASPKKHWLVCPEYRVSKDEMPKDGELFVFDSPNEDEVIQRYFDSMPIAINEKICIDATGFIRPHLLFLMRFLYLKGYPSVDMVYSEPNAYKDGSQTRFSAQITDVRPVRGYEGAHLRTLDAGGEYLIVGCGYDTDLMRAIATTHKPAYKVQMFPFPSLRPHMYQENRLKTQQCDAAFGRVIEQCFAPGYDPFATAQALSHFVSTNYKSIRNLYLSPLATKPQVIGFGWFYLMQCLGRPVSIVFPFSDGYNRETSVGLSEVWRYTLNFDLLRKLQDGKE